jgi:ABC-type transport system involved in multi-copper enzyme maturation permease subunit
MRRMLAIAGNTIREARRHKVFYSIFFFALVIILNSFLFSGLTIHFFDRILRNVGTGAIGFFGILLAIFLGVGMVSREVDRKTVYTVVTKPIRRAEFILGKFLGLMGVLAVSLGVMLVCFIGVLLVFSKEPVPFGSLMWHFVLVQVQLAIVVGFAILMSTFSSSVMAAFSTVALYLIGLLSSDLHFFGQRSESALVQGLSTGLYYGLPNLARFNVSHQVTYGLPIDAGTAGLSILYGLLYAGAFLTMSVVIFNRRDFK